MVLFVNTVVFIPKFIENNYSGAEKSCGLTPRVDFDVVYKVYVYIYINT